MHLNGHLLRSRYIREIGVLDADNRLICSTALGRLTQPVKGNYPIITLRSGRKLLNDVTLQMADKKLKAAIIQQGHFNVVLSPYLTDDLYRSADRSEEHTSELQSLMRISYAVFCLKKKNTP